MWHFSSMQRAIEIELEPIHVLTKGWYGSYLWYSTEKIHLFEQKKPNEINFKTSQYSQLRDMMPKGGHVTKEMDFTNKPQDDLSHV